MGPSGLFTAYVLNKAGFDVTLIDKGDPVEERVKKVNTFCELGILDESSNIQFGEGGAGTFSDGKLGTNVDSPYIRFIFEKLVEFGANKDILYEAKPHVGTDILREVIVNIRKHIIASGVKVMFNTELVDFDNTSAKLLYNKEEKIEYFDYLVLAVGHSATPIYELLKKKEVLLEPKNFAVGVRIEHLQNKINEVQYHGVYENLGAADYKLVAHVGSRSLYTFCMCPGGYVVNASSENDSLVINGMSNHARAGVNSNSAVAVSVLPTDYDPTPMGAIAFQRELESRAFLLGGSDYSAPIELMGDFLSGKKKNLSEPSIIKPSYTRGNTRISDISGIFPHAINEELNREKIGKIVDVLCEDFDPVAEVHFGRSSADAPEIDGKVYFRSEERIAPGSFVRVKVREVVEYDLYGHIVTRK